MTTFEMIFEVNYEMMFETILLLLHQQFLWMMKHSNLYWELL